MTRVQVQKLGGQLVVREVFATSRKDSFKKLGSVRFALSVCLKQMTGVQNGRGNRCGLFTFWFIGYDASLYDLILTCFGYL